MSLYCELKENKYSLAIIGLGYVGLPLAVEFSKHVSVIGYDIDCEKIRNYKKGVDVFEFSGSNKIDTSSILFTDSERDLEKARIFKELSIIELWERSTKAIPILIDLKNIYNKAEIEKIGFKYWCL